MHTNERLTNKRCTHACTYQYKNKKNLVLGASYGIWPG